jgi:Fe-S cluster assembly ATP-binding protein
MLIFPTFSLYYRYMLTIHSLAVSIGDTEIIHPLSYRFSTGETTVILGHNGSGKSSLALSIMGHPRYQITGQMMLDGQDISTYSPTDRHTA